MGQYWILVLCLLSSGNHTINSIQLLLIHQLEQFSPYLIIILRNNAQIGLLNLVV